MAHLPYNLDLPPGNRIETMMPRWLFWMFVTLVSWGIWGVLLRLAPTSITAAQSQALSTFGLLPIFIMLWLLKEPEPAGNRVLGVAMALVAGLISSVGNIAFYAALERAPASIVVPLTAMSPAVTVVLAAMLLDERIVRVQWLGLGLSLLAIYLFNGSASRTGDTRWIALALVPLVLWGVTLLLQKIATLHLSGRTSALWFLAAFVPLAVVLLMWTPIEQALSWQVWLVVCALGFTLGFGNLTIMWALAAGGRASIVAPLSGLYPMVSIPLAIGLLGERPGPREGLGIILALAAVVLLSLETDKPG